jgi:hypothetical protein
MSARAIASLYGPASRKGWRQDPKTGEATGFPGGPNDHPDAGVPAGNVDLSGFTDELAGGHETHFEFPWPGEEPEE